MGRVVASMFGAFSVNGNVPSILCEMKDPMEFPFAYKTAARSDLGVVAFCVFRS